MSEKFEVEVEVIRETDKALLVSVEGEEIWIPISQIDDDSEVYNMETGPGTLIIPMWLALEKGLV